MTPTPPPALDRAGMIAQELRQWAEIGDVKLDGGTYDSLHEDYREHLRDWADRLDLLPPAPRPEGSLTLTPEQDFFARDWLAYIESAPAIIGDRYQAEIYERRRVQFEALKARAKVIADRLSAPAEPPKGEKSVRPCAKCGKMEVYVTDADTDGHPDVRITCHACGHSYIVDGDDG